MSRPWKITVEDFPPLGDAWHQVEIKSIEPAGRDSIAVTLGLTTDSHCGRRILTNIPLPIRPDNLTARFFTALGFDTAVGAAIHPRQAVGRTLLVRFDSSDPAQPVPIEFKDVDKEPPHGV